MKFVSHLAFPISVQVNWYHKVFESTCFCLVRHLETPFRHTYIIHFV